MELKCRRLQWQIVFCFILHFIGITPNLHFHLDLCVSDSQSPDFFIFCVVILCGALFWQFH